MHSVTRRHWLQSAAALAAGLTAGESTHANAEKPTDPFAYCLNTSTLQGQKLDLVELIEITAKTGYQAIEPWAGELDRYVKDGGNLKDVAARLKSEVRRTGRPLKAVVNEALKRGLGLDGKKIRPPRFEVHPHAFGFQPGVDLDRLNQLVDELDVAEATRKLRS